jgi:hypothetical protein
MSYEIVIVAIGASNPCHLSYLTNLELKNEIEHPDIGRFQSNWPFMSGTKGLWYSIGVTDDGWFNPMSIIDIDFDTEVDYRILPYWIEDEDVRSNVKQIILTPEYVSDIEMTLKKLIESSPQQTIYFLCRFQGGDNEMVQGVLGLEQFETMLKESEICSNICYVITKSTSSSL